MKRGLITRTLIISEYQTTIYNSLPEIPLNFIRHHLYTQPSLFRLCTISTTRNPTKVRLTTQKFADPLWKRIYDANFWDVQTTTAANTNDTLLTCHLSSRDVNYIICVAEGSRCVHCKYIKYKPACTQTYKIHNIGITA